MNRSEVFLIAFHDWCLCWADRSDRYCVCWIVSLVNVLRVVVPIPLGSMHFRRSDKSGQIPTTCWRSVPVRAGRSLVLTIHMTYSVSCYQNDLLYCSTRKMLSELDLHRTDLTQHTIMTDVGHIWFRGSRWPRSWSARYVYYKTLWMLWTRRRQKLRYR